MSEERTNYKSIIVAIVIAVVIFVGWELLFIKPMDDKQAEQSKNTSASSIAGDSVSVLPSKQVGSDNTSNTSVVIQHISDKAMLGRGRRFTLNNGKIKLSINLRGAKIDSAILLKYKETVKKDSDNITLLHPQGTERSYFYTSGFVSATIKKSLPNQNTLWQVSKLSTKTKLILNKRGGRGLTFEKVISLDDNYMVNIEDKIINKSNKSISVYPWALIVRKGEPQIKKVFISHEGVVGFFAGENQQLNYSDIKKAKALSYNSSGGYFGFASKYFMVTLIPNHVDTNTVKFTYFTDKLSNPNYQADYLGKQHVINSHKTYKNNTKLFIGPKELTLLNKYSKKFNITKFSNSIDFGWFYFITKPFLSVLVYFYNFFDNFGYAMLLFTVLIRLVIFPISYSAYSSMARMRKLQPRLKALKEANKGNNAKYNQEVMVLYRKEKVNPVAGCLPLVIQIPILFSIYKVIYICIEMRHSVFWWIKDLSAPDPNSIFNLFGLLPYSLPTFLNIGFWAIFMGFTLYVQQKLSNTTFINDTQRRLMKWFPVFLTVILSKFPVGLIIYWTWSNLISIGQQFIINRSVAKRHGPKK